MFHQLARNFWSYEFECKCCGFMKINPVLVRALQDLRDMLGEPIHINSGYRCSKHNAVIGGVPQSQHVAGNAADIHMDNFSPGAIARAAKHIPAFRLGGIGIYNTFVHLDVRGVSARWDRRTKNVR